MATTQIEKKTEYGFGTAGHGALGEQFATFLEEYIPDVAQQLQQSFVDKLNTSNPDVPAFDPNWTDAPGIEKFYPDRGWPAGGTTNPKDITPGPPAKSSGAGSQDEPINSSKTISSKTIGSLILGSSKPG